MRRVSRSVVRPSAAGDEAVARSGGLLILSGEGHDACHGWGVQSTGKAMTGRHFWAELTSGGLESGPATTRRPQPQEHIMDLVETLQNLLGQVPELVQPLIAAIANPVVAAIAATAGNFLVVTVLVLLSSGARRAKFQRAYERYGVPGREPLGGEVSTRGAC